MRKIIFLCLFFASQGQAQNFTLGDLENIYAKIKHARGETSKDIPTLEIIQETKNIASYNRRTKVLAIEAKAIETCKKFGSSTETAIAFLMGHELTHFYQKHEGEFSFFMSQATFTSKLEEEAQADIYGAMLAYWAGYKDITTIMPRLIELLYHDYDMMDEIMPKYPSLTKRKALIEQAVRKSKTLIDLYESAKYMTVLGNHNYAADIYQYIGEFAQTKELWNNEATAYLVAASQIKQRGKTNWYYPISLDISNPLRVPSDIEQQILIKKAKDCLQNVLRLDNNYFLAYLNYAIANSIEGNIVNATAFLNHAETLAHSLEQQLQIKLVKAILWNQKGKTEEGLKLLTSIENNMVKSLAQLAKRNKQLIINSTLPIGSIPSIKLHTETIAGIDLNNAPTVNFSEKIDLNPKDPTNPKLINLGQFPNSTLLYLETYDDAYAIHFTPKSSTSKWKIRMKAEKIPQFFRAETYDIVSTNQGNYFMVFSASRLVFLINSKNQLVEWAQYAAY